MSETRSWSRLRRSRGAALLLTAVLATACVDDTVGPPGPEPGARPPAEGPRVLGFIELTFSGIGTPEMSSSVLSAPSLAALEELRAERARQGGSDEAIAFDLTPPENIDDSGDGTIQLAVAGRSQFTFNGQRYLRATFNVRNAQVDGTAYDTPRNNLTFLGVGTSNAINQTAVSKLELAGGTPAPPALALQVLPTARVELDADSLVVPDPDVVQLLTEAEAAAVAAIAPPAVTSVFPYGFVVRRVGNNTTRTLPASPAPTQFDGVVDFAFRMPEEAQSLSVLMLAVDDSETRLTQSLEQQTTAARDALLARATALTADTVTLLPGGSLPTWPDLRTLCTVRTAGPAGAATAHLVNVAGFQSFSPTPNSTIADTAFFQATFTQAVSGIGPNNFTVTGAQSGPAFTDTTYTGNGTPTITTPRGNFLAGEQVQIELPDPCPTPQLAQYTVQPDSSPGTFQPDTTYPTGSSPSSVAIGDLNGDGSLDLAVANDLADNVSVLLNNNDGSGTFQPDTTYPTGSGPSSVAIGDLNGDGSLDLAATSGVAIALNVSVLLNTNDGSGTFQPDTAFTSGDLEATDVAIGDLNGDGSLDLAVANAGSKNVAVLLNNDDGSGTFQPFTTFGTGLQPASVAIGDLNGDGSFDLVTANLASNNVSVLLNNNDGSGSFRPAITFGVGINPTAVAIGDLNGDGILDLATANGGSNNVSVLLGQAVP